MPEVGSASLAIIPSFKGFQGNLERGVGPEMDRAGKSGGDRFGAAAGTAAGGRFKATFGKAAKAALLGVGALGVGAIKLAGDSVKLASDLNESLNAVNVTYGKQAKGVQKLGKQAADSLGLSRAEFNSLSVRFSAFSKTIAGGDGKKVVTTLDDLTTRAADFASVMNLDVNAAAELFQSGLAGETEPLRKYGLDLSAAAVEAYALSEGIVKNKGDLTEAAKVQARYGLLMEKTSKTQGDFANTSDSLANRQRILSARWDDARATLGTALLPMLEDLSGWVLDKGIPAFEDFAEWFQGPGIKKIQGFGRFLRDDLAPPLKSAADFAGDLAGALNDLPKSVKIGGLAALGGLYGLGKLKRSPLGTAASVAGLGKGTPVYVTNWAQIAAGDAAAGGGGGKMKWLKYGGGAAAAGAAAAAGTYGIAELQKNVAPKAYEKGIFGTPRNAGFDGLLDDLNKVDKEGSQAGEILSDAFGDVRDSVGRAAVQAGLFGQAGKRAADLARGGVENYDGALRQLPRDVRTALTLLGVDEALSKVRLLGRDLDWVARPRESRITITRRYADAGYQTRGGLQEGGGGPVSRGVTINVGEVRAHDYNDMVTQLERRTREARMDGLR